MRQDITNLEINRIILHRISGGRQYGGDEVELSPSESRLGEGTLGFIHDKLVGALSHGIPVAFDTGPEANVYVPGRVMSYFLGHSGWSFVGGSQEIARHLMSVQPKNSPRGMLAIGECSLGGLPAFAIMKLEHDRGIAASRGDDGNSGFIVEFLDRLMLTSKSNVFKAGLFVKGEKGTPEDVDGRVLDNQAGRSARRDQIAGYFLHKFLGCKYVQNPAFYTRGFRDESLSWANSAALPPEVLYGFVIGVLSEISNNSDSINSEQVAARLLPPEYIKSWLDHLSDNEVPTGGFPKDTELVGSPAPRLTMRLGDGLKIDGGSDVFDNKVKVNTLDDGPTVEVRITDDQPPSYSSRR